MTPGQCQTTSDLKQQLIQMLENRSAKICIVGGGYVGLPLAMLLVRRGFRVTVVDHARDRVRKLNLGQSYISDISNSELNEARTSGRFDAIGDFSQIPEAQVVVLALPTPLSSQGEPDLRFIDEAGQALAPHLKSGQLVCLESTTYPGTTCDRLVPLLTRHGLVADQNLFVAYSPERIDPTNAHFTLHNTPRLVAGVGLHSEQIGKYFYEFAVGAPVHVTSSTQVAELAKLFENTFRLVNIALVNEMAVLCDKLELSVWEVLAAANTKPFGILGFQPGPGAGGHCIPLDPQYLTWKATQHNSHCELISTASKINQQMPSFVCGKIERLLNAHRVKIQDARILLLGVAYKPEVADTRESAAVAVLAHLRAAGARVEYSDPYVPTLQISPEAGPMHSQVLADCRWDTFDLVVITTHHRAFDYEAIVKSATRVLDTRNATADLVLHREKITLL